MKPYLNNKKYYVQRRIFIKALEIINIQYYDLA
jgi:hypothetical protein